MTEPKYDKEHSKWVVSSGKVSFSFRTFVAAWEFYQFNKDKV